MPWTYAETPVALGATGSPDSGAKLADFPPVPPNQAAWWQDFVWTIRQEFARRSRFQSPHVSTMKTTATGLDTNGIGQLQIVITTGAYEQLTGSAGLLTFTVGEVIFAPGSAGASFAQATKAAIVTKVAGTVAAPILNYTLIQAPATGLFTDFVNTDLVKGQTSGATCTAAAPVNVFYPT